MIVIGLVFAFFAYHAFRHAHRHWLGPNPAEWFGSDDAATDVVRRAVGWTSRPPATE